MGTNGFPPPERKSRPRIESSPEEPPMTQRPPFADVNARALAVIRIGVGILFLIFGEYKVFGSEFTLHGGFQFWINRFIENGAYPFMVPVLRNIVLAHATMIAFLVAYGELAIGLSLILGVQVRTASAAGFIYMTTLLFSSNYPGPQAVFWQYFGASLDHSVFALCFVALLLGRSEIVWSVSSWRVMHVRATASGSKSS
jgi:uncharacterized membrane protein YphA (DoxX/SURF4 family)